MTTELSRASSADEVRAVFRAARAREEGRETVVAQQKPSVDKNNGVMVAFFLPQADARALALPGGEPARDLHITLAILGTTDEFTPARIRDLKRTMSAFAADYDESAPLTAELVEVRRFPANPQSGQYAAYAAVESPALLRFRAALVAHLEASGFPYDQTFPNYTPHVTLAYLPDGAPLPVADVAHASLAFDQVWLAVGGERFAFPIGDEQFGNRAVAADNDPATRALDALLARLEQVATARAEAQTEAGLRELRTRVLEGITL